MRSWSIWAFGLKAFCIALFQSKSQHNRYDVITHQYVMFQHNLLTKLWISQWTKNMEKDRQDTNIVPFVTRGRIEMQKMLILHLAKMFSQHIMSGNDILKSLHAFRSWWKPFSVTHGYPTSPGRTLPYMAIASHWVTSKGFLIWASRCVETIVKHGIFEEVTSSVELLHNVSFPLSSIYWNRPCVWRTPVRRRNSCRAYKQTSSKWTLSNQQL